MTNQELIEIEKRWANLRQAGLVGGIAQQACADVAVLAEEIRRLRTPAAVVNPAPELFGIAKPQDALALLERIAGALETQTEARKESSDANE